MTSAAEASSGVGATADPSAAPGPGEVRQGLEVNGEDQGKSPGASLETLTLQGQAERPRPPEHPSPIPPWVPRGPVYRHPAPVGQASRPLIRSGTWLPLCKQRGHLPGSWGAAASPHRSLLAYPGCRYCRHVFPIAAVSTGKAPSRSLRL